MKRNVKIVSIHVLKHLLTREKVRRTLLQMRSVKSLTGRLVIVVIVLSDGTFQAVLPGSISIALKVLSTL